MSAGAQGEHGLNAHLHAGGRGERGREWMDGRVGGGQGR